MTLFNRIATCCTVFTVFVSTRALPSQSAQALPSAIVNVSAPNATSTDHFGAILGLRALPDGRLLVNDGLRHQLILLDANLTRRAVVLDSGAVGAKSYGSVGSPLLPYLGDSSLFVDAASLSLVVLDGKGEAARVVAAPVPTQVRNLSYRGTATDAQGRLVYGLEEARAVATTSDSVSLRKAVAGPDSEFVVRAAFNAPGVVDTIGRVKLAMNSRVVIRFAGANAVATILHDPMPSQDDFAVLSDGSVAFVRGHDYHVDVITPSGQHIAGAKLPFDWKRLSDQDKQALVDSAQAYDKKMMEVLKQATRNPATAEAAMAAVGITIKRSQGGVGDALTPRPTTSVDIKKEYAPLPAAQIDDYYPPIRSGALRPDLDGNLWILPTTSAQSRSGELIYDVVNGRGEFAKRVRLPSGRSIAGFAKNGVVFLMSKDANGWTLERVSVLSR